MFSSNAVFIPKCTRTTLTKDFFAMNWSFLFQTSICILHSDHVIDIQARDGTASCDNETVLTTRFSAIIGHFYLINVF